MSDFDWATLEDDVTEHGEFQPAARASSSVDAKTVRFPCQACNGTGNYQGVRRHQPKTRCFACRGQGYFLTSERDRSAKRAQTKARKVRKLGDARAAFDEANPGVSEFLASAASWSEFAGKLLADLAKFGALTEKQAEAARNFRAKVQASQAARSAAREAERKAVDLSPIRAMFETALGNGHKRPIYRAEGLVINRAPDFGENPGALYVKTVAGDYLGKIIGTNYTGRPAPALTAIAANPREMAEKYGRATGTCSCCGRELTDPVSIAAGIGPICVTKWGL